VWKPMDDVRGLMFAGKKILGRRPRAMLLRTIRTLLEI
jgi:hypothetical protein